MWSDDERRFRAARSEQLRVLRWQLVESLVRIGPILGLLLAGQLKYGKEPVLDSPWVLVAFLLWFVAHAYDRTRDVVIRSYGMTDGETAKVHPLDRMTSAPVLATHWLYGPRIGADFRLTGVIFGKDTRREWIRVGQLPEATRQELLAYLTEKFERRRLGDHEGEASATASESPRANS